MNAFYYYKTTDIIDVDKSNMPESQRSLGPAACMPGYPIVEDKNGDGIIDVNDSYMDNMLPKLYFGFGNTHIVIVQMPEISPEEWMRTMLVSILITSGIPRQT